MTALEFTLCHFCKTQAYDRCSCGQLVCAYHHLPDENDNLVCPGCSDLEFPDPVIPDHRSQTIKIDYRSHTITAIHVDSRGWNSRIDGDFGLSWCSLFPTADDAIAAGREQIDTKLDKKQTTKEKSVIPQPNNKDRLYYHGNATNPGGIN